MRYRSQLSLLAVLLGLSLGSPSTAEEGSDQVAGLREGNRLFREGRLEEAHAVYVGAYDPEAPHPVLAYNTGATAHQLGHLPEAILWYRRAALLNPGDPWLVENLQRARTELGLQAYPSPGVVGRLARYRSALLFTGALLAWAGLLWWMLRPRRAPAWALGLFAGGAVLYLVTLGATAIEPEAAVVLELCSSEAADLPPGSEVWVRGETSGGLSVRAGVATLECPHGGVELVDPRT